MAGAAQGEVILFQPRIGYMDTLRSRPSMPLSLIHAASELCGEYHVRIIDQRLDREWARSLAEALVDSHGQETETVAHSRSELVRLRAKLDAPDAT